MNLFRCVMGLFAGILGVILLLPILLLISPWLIVAGLTILLAKWLEPSYLRWNQVVEYDPSLGWRTKPNLKGYHLADDGVYLTTTDAEGWRGKSTIDESDVVVFGDSYVFGHAINDANFFADLNPHLRIKAIGVSGYSMVQEYMCITRLASRLRGKLIVWFVYIGNDLSDSLATNIEGYRAPFLRENRTIGEWEIVTSHVDASRWPSGPGYHNATFYERVAKLFVPGPFSARVFSACEYLIEEADRIIRGGGAQLIVVSIPSKNMLLKEDMQKLTRLLPRDRTFDPDYPDRELSEICRRLNVDFVAGKNHLNGRDYRAAESHWNRKGHQKVARLLAMLHSKMQLNEQAKPLKKERALECSVMEHPAA